MKDWEIYEKDIFNKLRAKFDKYDYDIKKMEELLGDLASEAGRLISWCKLKHRAER